MKRIDNYGPPNAKSPFGASEEKSDAKIDVKPEDIASKKGEPQTSDKNVSQAADLSGKHFLHLSLDILKMIRIFLNQ